MPEKGSLYDKLRLSVALALPLTVAFFLDDLLDQFPVGFFDDRLDGKIDLIVTKSVSRFARNTVDSLTTIRKLKDAGCECYFEKENIWTFDGKGELLLTIMSSLAQEESRSISENVTWGQRKRFADGKVHLPVQTLADTSIFRRLTQGEKCKRISSISFVISWRDGGIR